MEIVIRAMKKEDWDAVAEIFQEGINLKTSTFHKDVPTYEVWDKIQIPVCRLVAEAEDEVIGWTALQPVNSRPAYSGVAEVSIYVKSAYRGKGIGEKLLQALIEESEQQGFWTLQSGIFEINKASIALHEKVGFRMVGYRERIAKDCNGEWQNTVLMERRSGKVGL